MAVDGAKVAKDLDLAGLGNVVWSGDVGSRLVAVYNCPCGSRWIAPKEDPTKKPPAPWRAVWKGFGGWRWLCGECKDRARPCSGESRN